MAATMQQLIEEFLAQLSNERSVGSATVRNYRFYLTRFSAWRQFPEPAAITADTPNTEVESQASQNQNMNMNGNLSINAAEQQINADARTIM